MARYIDADKLKKRLLTISVVADNLYGMGINRGLDRAETAIDMMPAADVAPKSKVDNLKVLLEMNDKAYNSLRELYHTDTEALVLARQKTEIEVARKIFEEIRREIKAALKSNYNAKQERVEKQIPDDFVSYMCEGKIAALRGIDDFIDELEMKYTEDRNERK